MKIGIFLKYNPKAELTSEGLGRLLGNLVKGFQDAGHDVTIACPKWSITSLEDLLEDFQVKNDGVRILSPGRYPVLWNIYQKFILRIPQEKKSLKYVLYSGIAGLFEKAIYGMVEMCSWAIFLLSLVALGICGILLLPFILVALVLMGIASLVKRILKKGKGATKNQWHHFNQFYTSFSSRRESINETLYHRLLQFVGQQLVDLCNREGTVDIWFVPTLFWKESLKLKGTVVLTAPDLVTQEFPLGFANYPGVAEDTEKCSELVEKGSYFTVYSNVVKNEVLVTRYRKDPDKVAVIPNIMNKCDQYLGFASPAMETYRDSRLCMEQFSRSLLYQLPKYSAMGPYVNDFSFNDVKYIFYASQLRYSKNIYNLLQAYLHLLRKRNVQIKLFLTCSFEVIPEVQDFIVKNRLQYDVLAFTRVPVQQLAALYCCAELVVNPTLYEGGFLSFTFGEGMSVGTPSVMSRIPQVTEVTDQFDLDDVLFDPYDYMDMARKIEYWLEHKDELYQKELPLYRELDKRTPAVLADEYVRAFEYFADMNKRQKGEKEGEHSA